MNPWIQRLLWIAGLIVALGAVNTTIAAHERTLTSGRVVLLPLAPVDPRSLMQGDYMALQFDIARSISEAAKKANVLDGYAVLTLNSNDVATFSRLYVSGDPLAANEQKLQFRTRKETLRIVTDAYFFQEGTANAFADAKFGQFRVNPNGTALLVAMLDTERRPIVPKLSQRAKDGVQVRE